MPYIRKNYVIDQTQFFEILYGTYGSIRNLAKEIGVSNNSVCTCLKPGKTVNRKTVETLASALKVPVEAFARQIGDSD